MPQRAIPETTSIQPFDPVRSLDSLAGLVPREVLERWRAVDRSSQNPRVVTVDAPDGPAVALVTARPGTAYLKIVDVVGVTGTIVAAILDHAREQGAVQVKWEGWTVGERTAAAAGFTPLATPLAPGDAPDRGPGGPQTGYVRWLVAEPPIEPPYYRQSESFSCGAVTALIGQVQAGALAPDEVDRDAELRLWRAATNFAACEPVGLGVAVRRAWPDSSVTVALDTDRPVLVHFYAEAEQGWRSVLQRASREDAAELGVPIDPRRLSLPDIRSALAGGEQVLLLISLAAMLGYDVPHWVLCHGSVAGAVVLEDPWVDEGRGETWLDAHLLPVPDRALDAMSVLEEGRFRGAVRIGAARTAV